MKFEFGAGKYNCFILNVLPSIAIYRASTFHWELHLAFLLWFIRVDYYKKNIYEQESKESI